MFKELISETILRIEATEARDRGRKIDDKLRFDHAVRYILIELWKSVKTLPTSEVSINKRSGYYSENKRYRDPLLTYKQTMAVYKGLLKLGFIEVTKEGHFDRNLFQGKITRIVAKEELLERLLELEGHPSITVPNDLNKETILLRDNVNGKENVAVGFNAMYSNTTGNDNVAIGNGALDANTTSSYSTAVGKDALTTSTGPYNTAMGVGALALCTSGQQNTAVGYHSSRAVTTGLYNTSIGLESAKSATTGSYNTCLGYRAGHGQSHFSLTTESNRIVIGYSNTTNAYIQVAWTVVSDARDKTEIEDIGVGLDLINELRPVSYKFVDNREDKNPVGRTKYGLLAQEVLEVEGENPVIIDDEQEEKLKMTTDNLTTVLVKAVQELSAEVEELKAEVQALKG